MCSRSRGQEHCFHDWEAFALSLSCMAAPQSEASGLVERGEVPLLWLQRPHRYFCAGMSWLCPAIEEASRRVQDAASPTDALSSRTDCVCPATTEARSISGALRAGSGDPDDTEALQERLASSSEASTSESLDSAGAPAAPHPAAAQSCTQRTAAERCLGAAFHNISPADLWSTHQQDSALPLRSSGGTACASVTQMISDEQHQAVKILLRFPAAYLAWRAADSRRVSVILHGGGAEAGVDEVTTVAAGKEGEEAPKMTVGEAFRFLIASKEVRCLAVMAISQGIATNLLEVPPRPAFPLPPRGPAPLACLPAGHSRP